MTYRITEKKECDLVPVLTGRRARTAPFAPTLVEGKTVLHGMSESDSIVLDPHKALFLPYGTGAVLVKDRKKLYAAFNAEADYIQSILDMRLDTIIP